MDSTRRADRIASPFTLASALLDPITLPTSLDKDVEKMLEQWYTGYGNATGKSTGSRYSSVSVPYTPDSVYVRMLNKMPSAMRFSYNPLVREAIELYLFKRRGLLSSMLSLGDLYFPEIEMALDKNGLPMELRYLVIVESALNPKAISPAGAAGLWQLMLPTGKIYGLTVNSLVDERMDPVKSTEAACRFLKDLYRIYGDWWLVLAAYNCGPGNVNRALRRVNTDRPNFWDIYRYLPNETRRYIPPLHRGLLRDALPPRVRHLPSSAGSPAGYGLLHGESSRYLRSHLRDHGGIDGADLDVQPTVPPWHHPREQYALSRTPPPLCHPQA